jgi:nicotinamidase-related amidase
MAKTALVIVDMQNVFHQMVTAAIPRIQELHSFFTAESLPVLFTQHGHTTEELTPPFKNQLVRRWGPDGSIHKGSKDWELIPTIKKFVEDSPVVAKNTYDAFINTDLDDILRERGVGRVVVCGVMTDCCCDTTARSAFNRGYETWLISDACGSANKRQHEMGLTGFDFMCDGVMTTANAISKLEKGV